MLISGRTGEDIQRRQTNWGIIGVECALTIIMWKLICEIQYPYELSHLLAHKTFSSRVIFLLSLSAGIVNDFNNLDFCTPMSGVRSIATSCQPYVQLKYNILDHIQSYRATIIMKSFKEMLHMWLVDLRTAAAARYHLITSCRSDSRVWEVSGFVSHAYCFISGSRTYRDRRKPEHGWLLSGLVITTARQFYQLLVNAVIGFTAMFLPIW